MNHCRWHLFRDVCKELVVIQLGNGILAVGTVAFGDVFGKFIRYHQLYDAMNVLLCLNLIFAVTSVCSFPLSRLLFNLLVLRWNELQMLALRSSSALMYLTCTTCALNVR